MRGHNSRSLLANTTSRRPTINRQPLAPKSAATEGVGFSLFRASPSAPSISNTSPMIWWSRWLATPSTKSATSRSTSGSPSPQRPRQRRFPYQAIADPGSPQTLSVTVPLADVGVQSGSCPYLFVALYATMPATDGSGSDEGWADGTIFLDMKTPDYGWAFETSCCLDQPGSETSPSGDTDINDQLGPIYQGSEATQLEVAPGAIDTVRTSAIRGSVISSGRRSARRCAGPPFMADPSSATQRQT